MIFLILAIVEGLEPQELINQLNKDYSEISGNSIEIYGLINNILWEFEEKENRTKGILLLNNTFKGLYFHFFEIEESDKVYIKNHSLSEPIFEPTGVLWIQRAILKEIQINEFAVEEIYVYKMVARDTVLYSANVAIGNYEHQVDVLIHNDTINDYIKSTAILAVPEIIYREKTKLTRIFLAGIIGFSLCFFGLFLFYRNFSTLPFSQGIDFRVYLEDKNT